MQTATSLLDAVGYVLALSMGAIILGVIAGKLLNRTRTWRARREALRRFGTSS